MPKSKEKRRGGDRRTQEGAPPKGWSERRRSVERRLPDVEEISFSEWLNSLPTKEDSKVG
jgi:hypothetical protein